MVGQIILDIGAEGGGLTLFGDKDSSGEWVFWTRLDETATVEALDEEDRLGLGDAIKTSRQVHSLPEAMKLLDRYPWFQLYPLEIHPEFRDKILLEVRRRGTLTDQARWNDRMGWPAERPMFEETEDRGEIPAAKQQDRSYRVGAIVELEDRPEWGPGKIVNIDKVDRLNVIFGDLEDPFSKLVTVDSPALRVADLQRHPVLELHGCPVAIALFGKFASLPATTFQCPADDAGKAKLALEIEREMRRVWGPWEDGKESEKEVFNALFPIMSKDPQATKAVIALLKVRPTRNPEKDILELLPGAAKMTDKFREGMIVDAQGHPNWGPGKIVHVSGNYLHIVFRDAEGAEAKVFSLDATGLKPTEIQSDPILDNLPPLIERDRRWYLPKRRLSLDAAVQIFLRHFPAGFSDPKYKNGERKGKDDAHRQFNEQLGLKELRGLLEADDVVGLSKRILSVKAPVNELLAPFENAAFHDSMQDTDAARGFFVTLLSLLESPEITPGVFEPYLDAVLSLPVKRSRVASWPVATLLPHIAQPDRHMFLKPENTKKAAVTLGFDLQYDPKPNWTTYAALLRMGNIYLDLLRPRGARDFVDVQTFIFVAGGGYDT